jgi:galactose oxidase
VLNSKGDHIETPATPSAVFHAGPSQAMNFFTTKGTGGRRAAGTRPGGDQMNGNAVMYASGKILCVGGANHYDGPNATPTKDGVAKTVASIVTITAPATGNPTASSKVVGSMTFPRSYGNAVALPDGKVVVIGGMPFPVAFSDDDSILHPGTTPCC